MKVNQWTLGLAAVGVVSLASVARAEEGAVPLLTALSATTISGYVDTSIEWNENDYVRGSYPLTIRFRGKDNKSDGFNLNVVKLTIEKPLDETEWAAGYKVDLLFGPDAVNYNPTSEGGWGDMGIKQAYVALRTPVGNGIDWKIGAFDTIIGYEAFESGHNPNFTRSWGYALEPTQHTGVLATYRATDLIALAAGVANTSDAGLDTRNSEKGSSTYWRKTVMGSVAVTAPDSMGFLAGSTLYAGIVSGLNSGGARDEQHNYYFGATFNTPVTGLRAGAAFDCVDGLDGVDENDAWSLAGYLSYQATEKLSLHGRIEWTQFNLDDYSNSDDYDYLPAKGDNLSITGTVQYDLWENVISRLEVRYDDANAKDWAGEDAFGLYANVIYKF